MSASTLASLGLTAALVATLAVPNIRPQGQARRTSGLVTLYARDDLACALDLRSGGGGQVLDGEIRLDDTQLAYDVFEPGFLTVGFVHDERVAVLDLGEVYVPPQERTRDGALEYPLALFHSLQTDGPRFLYSGPGGARHEFEDASRFLGSIPPPGLAHVEPRVGHTYLVRARRTGVGGADDLFRFHVVAHRRGESVTLRWARVP